MDNGDALEHTNLDILEYTVYIVHIQYMKIGRLTMKIIISNSSQEPIYGQIVTQMKEMIMKGELFESAALPSIRNLAKELQISVITTKRAYDELEKDGYIVTVPGKGTYVAAQNRELMRETRMKLVEEKLNEAIMAGKSIDLTLEELQEMLKLLYEEA